MKKEKKNNTAAANGYTSVSGASGVNAASSPQKAKGAAHTSAIPKKKSHKGLKIFAVIFMCVLIACLSVALVMLLVSRPNNNPPPDIMPRQPIENMSGETEYDPGSVIINNAESKVDYKKNLDKIDFPFDEFFGSLNIPVNYLTDDQTVISVTAMNQTAVFTIGSNIVEVTNNNTGTKFSVEIETAPYTKDGKQYFYINDMCYVFRDACVHFDAESEITTITFGSVEAAQAPSVDSVQQAPERQQP